MKQSVTLFFALIFFSLPLSAQKGDVGFAVGSTLFFGDLGGANYIGRPLFFDLERSLIKPVGTLFYHYQYSRRIGFRLQGSITGVAGDDKLIQPKDVFAPEWFRWYRNLNFHTSIWEVSGQVEIYLTKYQAGSLRFRWGPYILAGAGVFHMNPKTEFNGATINLHDLHTEGQGFPGSGIKQYMLYQVCFPVGAGLRYNMTPDFTIGFEYADRKTFTDYIDDVSSSYVSQAEFDSYFSNDPASAALAYQLSMRSDEIDPDGVYGEITSPGQQRGDTKDLDHFIYAQFYFAYTLGPKHKSKKSSIKCMKWGGSEGESKGRYKR